eukprot:scaffold379274_cov45-Prasinocladus_malaysianus.AAC.1
MSSMKLVGSALLSSMLISRSWTTLMIIICSTPQMKNSTSCEQLDSYINVSSKVTRPSEVEQTYDEWAATYEEDSADLLGFTSPE